MKNSSQWRFLKVKNSSSEELFVRICLVKNSSFEEFSCKWRIFHEEFFREEFFNWRILHWRLFHWRILQKMNNSSLLKNSSFLKNSSLFTSLLKNSSLLQNSSLEELLTEELFTLFKFFTWRAIDVHSFFCFFIWLFWLQIGVLARNLLGLDVSPELLVGATKCETKIFPYITSLG